MVGQSRDRNMENLAETRCLLPPRLLEHNFQGRQLGPRAYGLLTLVALTLAVVVRYGPVHVAKMRASQRSFSQSFLGKGPKVARSCMVHSPEPVDCQLTERDRKSLVFLSSTALDTPEATATFEAMAKKLPAVRDNSAAERYSGVKVLLLEDPAFLKRSFWDDQATGFDNPRAVNYRKIAAGCLNFDAEDVKAWTGGFENLDGSWAYDNAGADGLGKLGLDPDAFVHVSIFGMCASKEQAKALFQLQAQNVRPNVSMKVFPLAPCLAALRKLIEESSILFANGGNPDLYGFVLKKFAPELGDFIAKRVREGSLFYMGRSAGAMAGSRDFALTYEPNPQLTTVLLGRETAGLALAGECALRPHIHDHLWDIPSRVYEKVTGETVVLAANGEALFCDQGCCGMTGKTHLTDDNSLSKSHRHASRMVEAYEAAYRSYAPSLAFGKQPADSACKAAGPVLLASSDLDTPPAKEKLKNLIQGLPSTENAADQFPMLKVLSLDDGALLSREFWDAASPRFAEPGNVNHVLSAPKTPLATVLAATEDLKGLRSGGVTNADAAFHDLGVLEVLHLSAFDQCASIQQKNSLFLLQAQGKKPEVRMDVDSSDLCVKDLEKQLAGADVLVAPSGNADLLAYVYTQFAPSLGNKIAQRVKDGAAVFVGQGAGAIFAGKSIALTAGPNAGILRHLLHDNMDGLKLTSCAIRPSWDKEWWDLSASILEDALQTDIVGLEDGDVLVCQGPCTVRGKTEVARSSRFSEADDRSRHRGRLHLAMMRALQKLTAQ